MFNAPNNGAFTVTTYRCLVCKKPAVKDADIINTGIAWLCPECEYYLKRIIEKERNLTQLSSLYGKCVSDE